MAGQLINEMMEEMLFWGTRHTPPIVAISDSKLGGSQECVHQRLVNQVEFLQASSMVELLRSMIGVLAGQKSGLQVCNLNAQSLLPKIDEFRDLFEGSKVDIICIT